MERSHLKNGKITKRKGKYGVTSDIGEFCRSRRRSAYGYFWRYQGSSKEPWDYVQKQGSQKVVRRISVSTEKVLQEYSSATEAYRDFEDKSDLTYSALCRACRDGTEYGGYFWEYAALEN